MYLKLKRWLFDFNGFDLAYLRPYRQSQNTQAAFDINKCAFQLVSMTDITEELPALLKQLQLTVNQHITDNEIRLIVQFRDNSTSQVMLYGDTDGYKNSRLNKHELSSTSSTKLIEKTLFQAHQQTVSLFCLFSKDADNSHTITSLISDIQQGLKMGLTVWCRNDQNISLAIQKERSIYASELHDSIAQVLAYLRMKTLKLDQLCNQVAHKELKPITTDLANYTHSAYQQTRELIVSSRLTFKSDNLSDAISNSITEFEQQSGIVFELDNRLGSQKIASHHAMQIIYIVRESLSNIVRHSHATHARVILTVDSRLQLTVKVEDNGQGIDMTEARNDSFGLQIMQERAARINAKLTIYERKAGGNVVELNLLLGVNDD